MTTRTMTLEEARRVVADARIEGDARTPFRGLAYDSRRVAAGDLFFAVPGFQRDGAVYVGEAVGSGAAAVVARDPVETTVPRLLVPDVRDAMGRIAARFHGDPSRELLGIGVTGTNGKTTVTNLAAAILDATGAPAGILGTITYRVGRSEEPAPRTTPEAPDLHRLLRAMIEAGNRSVVLEVSSHAIALGRVIGLSLDAMVFTNLTRDHLDFHGTMDEYYETKRRFFRQADLERLGAHVGRAVVNIDDPFGRRLAEESDLPVTTFGTDAGADVCLNVIDRDLSGSTLHLQTPRGAYRCRLPLPGLFNERNALAAIAAAEALALPREAIIGGIEDARPVPGRFQLVENALGFHVIVDYAHTPDALDALLAGLEPLVAGRLITVFGCGGNRDRGKRPLMGRAVGGRSDLAILTSDNPRREDPRAILSDVEPGLRESGAAYVAIVDRREAIARALDEARPGDAVVIAGKGHEEYQEIGEVRHPFADVEVARSLLREREGGKRVSHAGRS